MTGLIIGIGLIVITNALTALVCIYNARKVLRDYINMYEEMINRRDNKIKELTTDYVNLKFNQD